jgi:hypothetical protein
MDRCLAPIFQDQVKTFQTISTVQKLASQVGNGGAVMVQLLGDHAPGR